MIGQLIHKYKIEGQPLCKAKRPRQGFVFVQDNDYKRLSLDQELCQSCWEASEEIDKLSKDVAQMREFYRLYRDKVWQVLYGYKTNRLYVLEVLEGRATL